MRDKMDLMEAADSLLKDSSESRVRLLRDSVNQLKETEKITLKERQEGGLRRVKRILREHIRFKTAVCVGAWGRNALVHRKASLSEVAPTIISQVSSATEKGADVGNGMSKWGIVEATNIVRNEELSLTGQRSLCMEESDSLSGSLEMPQWSRDPGREADCRYLQCHAGEESLSGSAWTLPFCGPRGS